jgi:hypothetical protein
VLLSEKESGGGKGFIKTCNNKACPQHQFREKGFPLYGYAGQAFLTSHPDKQKEHASERS